MKNNKKLAESLLLICEHPAASRGYELLREFYLESKMIKEYDTLEHLLNKKFNDKSSNIDQKQ